MTEHASRLVSLDRLRARHAHGRVGAWSRPQDELAEVQGLPVLIRTQGMAASLAALVRRKRELAKDLAEWLGSGWGAGSPVHGVRSPADLLARYVALDVQAGRAVDTEARLYAEALKRFAGVLHARE